MRQVARTRTAADGVVCRMLICDRDAKWSEPVRAYLEEGEIHVMQNGPRGSSGRLLRMSWLGGRDSEPVAPSETRRAASRQTCRPVKRTSRR
jgi:hypothetical protein